MIWILAACVKSPPPAAAGAANAAHLERRWVSEVERDHPLVGVVWRVGAAAPATFDELLAEASHARWVFVGEKHDNADHHALQAEVVAAVRPRAVVFEHLDHDDPIGAATTSKELETASGWDQSGWPPFALYAPIFDAAYAAGARVLAGSPTRAEVKTAMSAGFAALPPEVVGDLPLEMGLPEDLAADLAAEVVQSHCGMADDSMVEKMLRAQLLKDTTMARAMRRAAEEGDAARPVVLIAGNGHTRGDRGVPMWIDDREALAMSTVSFVEVEAGVTDPTRIDPEGADWLVFTPRHDDEDPCAQFRK